MVYMWYAKRISKFSKCHHLFELPACSKKWERRNAAFNIKLIISFRSDKNPSTYSLNKRFKTLIRDIKRNKKRGENQSKGDCLLVFGGRPETGYRKSLNLNPFAIGPERNTPFPHLGRTMSTAWDRINTTYCSNDSNFLKDLTAPNSNSQHWTLVLTFKIPFEACKKERFSFYFSSEGRYEEREKKMKEIEFVEKPIKVSVEKFGWAVLRRLQLVKLSA